MKIRIGPAGMPISAKPGAINGLKRASELGLNALEIEFVRNTYMNNEEAKKVGEEAKKLGIELSIHGSYFVNFCSTDKKKLEESKKRILDAAERAHYMKANVVVFHPGYRGKLNDKEAYEICRDACRDMIKRMYEKGINDLNLGLESAGKKSAFGNLDENIRLSKEIKNCIPVIDFAHIYAVNGGKIDYKEIFEKLKFLKHIHSHFSGIQYSDKGELRHLEIKVNKPDFNELAKEILKRKLDITIINESPRLEMDCLIMKDVFKKLGISI